MKKAALILSGVFLALIAVSLAMEALHWALAAGHAWDAARIRQAAGGEYRILCVGESTTRGQYTPFLQQELDRDGAGRYRVFDEGLPARKTSDILRALPGNIEKYRPHMIIAMMGINDGGEFMPLRADSPLSRFRITRLAAYLWAHGKAKWREWRVARRPGGKDLDHAAPWQDADNPDPYSYPELDACIERGVQYGIAGNWPKVAESLEKAVTFAGCRDDFNNRSFFNLAHAYNRLDREDKARSILAKAERMFGGKSDTLLGAIAVYYLEHGDDVAAALYFERAELLRQSRVRAETRKNFLRLAQLARERNIELVVMQYPVCRLAPLRELLSAYGGIAFVDNEKIFKDAIRQRGFNALFHDQFAGDFGHANDLGNRMIAENLAATVRGKRKH